MPRKKSSFPKFSGSLTKPIDTGIILSLNEASWPGELQQHHDELHRQRMAKFPELARQLGIKFGHLDLTKRDDQVSFFGCLCENLVQIMRIPGFLEVRHKWSPTIVMVAAIYCGMGKIFQKTNNPGRKWSDFPVCLEIVRQLDPEMRKNANSKTARARAMQLRNRISAMRAKLKREQAERQRRLRKPNLKLVS